MKMPTDADRGIKIGGKESRRTINPPSTIEVSITPTVSLKNSEEQDPDQEKDGEVLCLVGGPQEMCEDEPEDAEVRKRLDE